MNGRRRDWLWLTAAPLVAALALGLSWYRTHAQEERLMDFLERNVGERDIVILLLTDTRKIQRLEGKRVLMAQSVYWNDVVGFRGAWIVGDESAQVPLLGHVTVRDIGPYRIHHLDMSEEEDDSQSFDLVGGLPLASVLRIDTNVHPCPLQTGQFTCPGEPWFSVSVRRVLMGGVGFECIYAHPKTDSRLRIVYPSTPGGSKLLLRGGIDDDGVNYPEGTDVLVTAFSGIQTLGTLTFTNTPGLQRRTLVFPQVLASPSPLVLEITTANQDTRHFCFRGQLVPSGDE